MYHFLIRDSWIYQEIEISCLNTTKSYIEIMQISSLNDLRLLAMLFYSEHIRKTDA